jgi:Flp pilus assembly protein TadD
MHNMQRSIRTPFLLAIAAAFLSACDNTGKAKSDQPAPGSDEALMAQGLAKLYQTSDPIGAEALFRDVLRKTPTHYGAHYQLAVALDRGGRPAQARPAWEEMRKLAEAINDTATLSTINRRLASPDTASVDAMMTLGLNLLHVKGDYPGAVTQFRGVLRKNPSHYGATYQLASALERDGKTVEARILWVRVLGMATQYKDEPTMAIARERLK